MIDLRAVASINEFADFPMGRIYELNRSKEGKLRWRYTFRYLTKDHSRFFLSEEELIATAKERGYFYLGQLSERRRELPFTGHI